VTNVQFMIIGHLAGADQLGYFLLAFNVSIWAQTILGTAIRYALQLRSTFQERDLTPDGDLTLEP